jgi:hypothetical protein
MTDLAAAPTDFGMALVVAEIAALADIFGVSAPSTLVAATLVPAIASTLITSAIVITRRFIATASVLHATFIFIVVLACHASSPWVWL